MVKLIQRGYCVADILKQFQLAKSRHAMRTHHVDRRIDVRKAFIKVKYSKSTNFKVLGRCLRKHNHLIKDSRIVRATSVQKNLFRILFPTMWR